MVKSKAKIQMILTYQKYNQEKVVPLHLLVKATY